MSDRYNLLNLVTKVSNDESTVWRALSVYKYVILQYIIYKKKNNTYKTLLILTLDVVNSVPLSALTTLSSILL